jgi:Carboxypeptidase regulatory-like domain
MGLQVPKSVCILIICICASTTTVAQQPRASEPQPGTIVGTVLDFTGGVIPGATVLLEGPNRNIDRHVLTDGHGSFKLDGVKPGTRCRVSVSAKGFANWQSDDIILTPGQYLILTGVNLRVATVQFTVNVVPPEEIAVQQVKAQEKQRIAGLIPNFYVVYEDDAVPLTPKLKFHLAIKLLTDPVTSAGFALNAAMYQVFGYPSYGQGAKGYGQRLGATFAGGYTKILIGDAVLASLLHQDTRYFYQGTGTTKSRLIHALSSPFVIKGDNGGKQINFSGIGGDVASGAIANAYYPDKDRGAGLVLSSTLIGIGGRAANAVVQEFILHKFTSRHTKAPRY